MKVRVSLVLAALACLLLVSSAYAVPNLISYQGVLNNSSGTPVNGSVSITFSIFDVATDGTALWSETQTVIASNGIFNVRLGSVQPLPASLFLKDELYLGMKVGADQEMIPRQRILSSGYTQRADLADSATLVSHLAVPIGTIMAWAKDIPGVPPLAGGWVECNGQSLSDPDSPLDGQTIPNLNATNRFLRGASASGGTGGVEQHNHSMTSCSSGNGFGGYETGCTATRDSSNIPPYYEVVWIIRVK